MKRNAFTLVELLIVISIISVLSTVGVVTFQGVQSKARDSTRKSDLQKLATALEIYFQQNSKYIVNTDKTDIASCQTDPTSSTFYTSIANNISGGTISDPSSKLAYCYISSNSGQGFRLFAKLENCSDSQIIPNINCTSANYNYSIVSDNLTLAAADPADVVAAPVPAPSASGSAPVVAPQPTAAPFPASGLVAYWKLDETASTSCPGGSSGSCDSSGNNYTAQWVRNASPTSSGKINYGMNFDGGVLTVQSSVVNTSAGTWAAWIKDNGSSAWADYFSIFDLYDEYMRIEKYGINIVFFASVDRADKSIADALCPADGNWHHVAVTYSTLSGVNFYCDGDPKGTPVVNWRQFDSSRRVYGPTIGARDAGVNTSPAKAIIDEVGVWNRALSADEVSALYNSGTGLTYAP